MPDSHLKNKHFIYLLILGKTDYMSQFIYKYLISLVMLGSIGLLNGQCVFTDSNRHSVDINKRFTDYIIENRLDANFAMSDIQDIATLEKIHIKGIKKNKFKLHINDSAQEVMIKVDLAKVDTITSLLSVTWSVEDVESRIAIEVFGDKINPDKGANTIFEGVKLFKNNVGVYSLYIPTGEFGDIELSKIMFTNKGVNSWIKIGYGEISIYGGFVHCFKAI